LRLDLEIVKGLGRGRVGGWRGGGSWRGRNGLGSGGVLVGACSSSERAGERRLRRESGIDGIVDGVVNYASLQEILEFLQGVS
jgi:hypothetical protein